jgi:hypothetical protein
MVARWASSEDRLLKIWALHSFQISQEIKTTRES